VIVQISVFSMLVVVQRPYDRTMTISASLLWSPVLAFGNWGICFAVCG
jgi:hypothetical protein